MLGALPRWLPELKGLLEVGRTVEGEAGLEEVGGCGRVFEGC